MGNTRGEVGDGGTERLGGVVELYLWGGAALSVVGLVDIGYKSTLKIMRLH